MIVVDVFFNGTAKRAFPKEDHLAQAFGFDAAEKAFDERNGGMEEWRNGGMEEWRSTCRKVGTMPGFYAAKIPSSFLIVTTFAEQHSIRICEAANDRTFAGIAIRGRLGSIMAQRQ